MRPCSKSQELGERFNYLIILIKPQYDLPVVPTSHLKSRFYTLQNLWKLKQLLLHNFRIFLKFRSPLQTFLLKLGCLDQLTYCRLIWGTNPTDLFVGVPNYASHELAPKKLMAPLQIICTRTTQYNRSIEIQIRSYY